MTLGNLKAIMSLVKYKDWEFRIMEKGDGFLVQVQFQGACAVSGKVEIQKGRKWYLSSHSCHAEVIRTLYKAVQAAEEHELQENFKYMGAAIFNPHISPGSLAEGIHSGAFCVELREAMPSQDFGAHKING